MMSLRTLIPALQLSVRAAVAAGVAAMAAQALGLDFPVYAMIAAVIVTDLSPARTRELALPRLAGTVLGGAVGAALASNGWHGPFAVAPGILMAMLLAQPARPPDAGRLAGYVCAIVVLDHHVAPWSYALYRCLETLLGIGVAVVVSLVPKIIPEHRTTGPRT